VGLVQLGIKAVVVKSVSRIFFRSAINQGLPILVVPDAVEAYERGDLIRINLEKGSINIGDKKYVFGRLPEKLMQIIESGGLVKWIVKSEHRQER
jgi:3-isopropylmalate dehydratase small subunit